MASDGYRCNLNLVIELQPSDASIQSADRYIITDYIPVFYFSNVLGIGRPQQDNFFVTLHVAVRCPSSLDPCSFTYLCFMKDITKKYSNGEVTIVWRPAICQHSTICWKHSTGLAEVFNPMEKPWIKPEAAPTEKIIDQVKKCPSGALTFYMNSEEKNRE